MIFQGHGKDDNDTNSKGIALHGRFRATGSETPIVVVLALFNSETEPELLAYGVNICDHPEDYYVNRKVKCLVPNSRGGRA